MNLAVAIYVAHLADVTLTPGALLAVFLIVAWQKRGQEKDAPAEEAPKKSRFGRPLREALATTQDIQAAHRLITEWSPYAPAQRSAAV